MTHPALPPSKPPLNRVAYSEGSPQGAKTCSEVGSQYDAEPVPISPALAVVVSARAATITTPQRAINPFRAKRAATFSPPAANCSHFGRRAGGCITRTGASRTTRSLERGNFGSEGRVDDSADVFCGHQPAVGSARSERAARDRGGARATPAAFGEARALVAGGLHDCVRSRRDCDGALHAIRAHSWRRRDAGPDR